MATNPALVGTDAITTLLSSPNYGEAVRTGAESEVRKIWDKVIRYGERSKNWTMGMEGTSEDSMILSKTDTSKGNGQTLRITTSTGHANVPVTGDNAFDDANKFDRRLLNGFDVTVDWVRFGYSETARMGELMGLRAELMNPSAVQRLGEQAADWMVEDMGMTFILGTNATGTFFAGGKSSFDQLTLNDSVGINDIINLSSLLRLTGTPPAKVGKDGMGNPINKYMYAFPSTALVPLRKELIANGVHQNADVRGDANVIYAGGLHELDGNIIRSRDIVNAANHGAIGCEQSPVAFLGKALTSGLTGGNRYIYGGYRSAYADLSKYTKPLRWFPGYSYTFASGKGPRGGAAYNPAAPDAGTPQDAPRYVVIENLSGADRGKWGMYRIASHNADGYMVHDVALANGTNCGNVVWSSANNTSTHPEGSFICPVTANGVPYGFGYAMGSTAIIRGRGMYTNHYTNELRDLGMVNCSAVSSVYGHQIAYDFIDRQVGFAVMVTAINHVGLAFCSGRKPTLAA